MAVILLRSDLMAATTDTYEALADVLEIDKNQLVLLAPASCGEPNRIVLTEDQARRLVTFARAGKSWYLESPPDAPSLV